MEKKITDVAKVIRSKNSSPFGLTFDIIFKDLDIYMKVKEKNLINKDMIASLYNIDVNTVYKIVYFDPAKAVKIDMKRLIASGSPGDTDVYGAQQHGPLLNIKFDL